MLYMKFQNFMSFGNFEIQFNGNNTKISGKNGVGKSSVSSGYLWCLFDCDGDLNFNPPIRRKIDGQSVDDVDVFVELGLLINGVKTIVRKVQRRKFSRDRTSYKDDNLYFWNEVPITLKEFNSRLEIDMKTVLMCSNINAFLSKKDKDMREYLFSKVEKFADIDIAKRYEELDDLVVLLLQYTTEEIEKMNKASKSKIEKEIPILDGQIKEKERDVTENADIDVAELELAKNGLKEKIKEIKTKQADISKQYEEYQKLSDGVLELKFELSDLERKANGGIEKQRGDIGSEQWENQKELGNVEHQIEENKEYIKAMQARVERNIILLNATRDNWKSANERVFDENSLVCPYCGQEYPTDKKEQLKTEFDAHKQEELAELTNRGNELKSAIDKDKSEIEQLKATLRENEKLKAELETKIEELETRYKELPQSIDISSTEEYKAIQSQISEKEAAMQKGNSADKIRQSLNTELSEAEEQLLEVEKQIAKADVSEDEKRLAELKKQRMDMEQRKTDCEKILDLLVELDKKKNESLSESINALFGIVDWKLFDFNKSGGYKSVCVPMVDNRSILTIESNKGNRLLGKLDIINSIQKIENICCPVFVDDSEAFDSENWKKSIDLMDCQMILLKVTEDSELKISQI